MIIVLFLIGAVFAIKPFADFRAYPRKIFNGLVKFDVQAVFRRQMPPPCR
jgi:hypothetical protein